jgi:hypothetical protein
MSQNSIAGELRDSRSLFRELFPRAPIAPAPWRPARGNAAIEPQGSPEFARGSVVPILTRNFDRREPEPLRLPALGVMLVAAVPGGGQSRRAAEGARMSEEGNLLGELRRVHQEYEMLNGRIRLARQRQQYSPTEHEQKDAEGEVSRLAREIDRLMTRMRAIEGNLREIRTKGRRRFQ